MDNKSVICREEFKDNIKGWLALNKHYHPHSKNKNIPIDEVLDIIDSLQTTPYRYTDGYIDGFKEGYRQAITDIKHRLNNKIQEILEEVNTNE